MGTDPRLPLVDPMPSPVGPPTVCEQTSISTKLEDGAKHWQPRAYGSPEWQRVYGRLRNAVEGMNGYAKDDARESIEPTQGRRVQGRTAQTFLLAFQIFRVNLRKIKSWFGSLLDLPHRRARHKTAKPDGTWTPTGHITPPRRVTHPQPPNNTTP